MKTLHN